MQKVGKTTMTYIDSLAAEEKHFTSQKVNARRSLEHHIQEVMSVITLEMDTLLILWEGGLRKHKRELVNHNHMWSDT